MKCDICKASVEETFLKKVVGSYMKDGKGKQRLVCPACQKKYLSKEKLLEALK